MTTTVTVRAHGKPVEVETTELHTDREPTVNREVLEGEMERTVYVHSTLSVRITELVPVLGS